MSTRIFTSGAVSATACLGPARTDGESRRRIQIDAGVGFGYVAKDGVRELRDALTTWLDEEPAAAAPRETIFTNINPHRMHLVVERRAIVDEGLAITLDEDATLGANDVVGVTMAKGAQLEDALELVRRMWVANAHKASS